MRIPSMLFFFLLTMSVFAQNPKQISLLNQVNELRSSGCQCGDQYMPSVGPLRWSKILMTSAYRHASDMNDNRYFSHYAPDGSDIGDRLDAVGYRWSYCGENLGIGQHDFEEVLKDWIRSPSHCRMLMSPKVDEIAIAHVGKFWVQHFGKPFEYFGN